LQTNYYVTQHQLI